MQTTVELAQNIAERLGEIDGIVAVALGGSWARGEAHPGSDVDLGRKIAFVRSSSDMSDKEIYRMRAADGASGPSWQPLP